MYPDLRMVSFNCKSIKNSICDVIKLCDNNDIIFIQEHWLPLQDLSYLGNIHKDFTFIASSPVDLSNGILTGRPYGGLAVLYNKNLMSCIKLIDDSDKRLLFIDLKFNDFSVLLVNCYMPYMSSPNSIDQAEYINLLYRIQSVIIDFNFFNVLMMGDFNCHPNTLYFKELVSFTIDYNYILSDVDLLGISSNTFTFISDINSSKRWLDHVISSQGIHSSINCVKVLDDYISSDHKPIQISLNNFIVVNPSKEIITKPTSSVKWSSLSELQIRRYRNNTETSLNFVIPNSILSLNETNYSVIEKDVNELYDNIVDSLYKSSNFLLKSEIESVNNKKEVPGWNSYVKDLHDSARRFYLDWRSVGSPRGGAEYQNMNSSRRRFKLAFRYCRKNVNKISADNIAKSFVNNHSKDFWKQISSKFGKNLTSSNIVEGHEGANDIAVFWKDHFQKILTSNKRLSLNSNYFLEFDNEMYVNEKEVTSIISKLKKEKSAGPDKLSNEHLIFSSNILHKLLSLLFTAMFKYSIIPTKLMNVFISPIIKDNCGDHTSKSNYRPISISCVISKVFESIILNKCKDYLVVNDNQFAFKQNHSTTMCVQAIKQIIFDYNDNSTPIYACFLDISKAFDCVNNDRLIEILFKRRVPVFIINILSYWFINQTFFVKWQNVISKGFNPTCGLRQGSVISPILFNVYINELSVSLNRIKSGCIFNNVLINNIIYADDIALLAPSWKGLQKLIYNCELFGYSFNVDFNTNKSKCMIFNQKPIVNVDNFSLNGSDLEFVNNFKYLGVTLNNEMNDDAHIETLYKKLCCKSNIISRKFNLCSYNVKNELFRTYCTNLYSFGLIAKFKISSFKKLKICYNNSFRIIHNLPRHCSASQMFISSRLLSFDELWRLSQRRILETSQMSKNSLIVATWNTLNTILQRRIFANVFV